MRLLRLCLLGLAAAIKRDERDFLEWRKTPRVGISPSTLSGGGEPLPLCEDKARKEPLMEAPHWFPPGEGSTVPDYVPVPDLPPPLWNEPEPSAKHYKKRSANDPLREIVDGLLNSFSDVEALKAVLAHKPAASRPSIEAVQAKIQKLKESADASAPERKLNAAEDEVAPTPRPTVDPDDRDFAWIESMAETLSTVRSFYHTMDCLVEEMDGAALEGGGLGIDILRWKITAKATTSLGQCMCGGIDYGSYFDDKSWGICRWMELFHRSYLCQDHSDFSCGGLLSDAGEPTPPTCMTKNEEGEWKPQSDTELPLRRFSEIATGGVIPRDLTQAPTEEMQTFYYLFRALHTALDFAKQYVICGLQEPAEALVPGWKTVRYVDMDQPGDPLLANKLTKDRVPFAQVLRRECDLLVTLRSFVTDSDGKIFLTNHHAAANVTDSEFGGYHAGFLNVAEDLYAAIEMDLEELQECQDEGGAFLSTRVLIAGHGFGAGVAQPLAHMIALRTEDSDNVPEVSAVLFGAPQAMNSRHIDDFNSRVNVRHLSSDRDVFPHLPCREVVANIGNPICTKESMVPLSQEDGKFAYYSQVNGRMTIDPQHLFTRSGDKEEMWLNKELLTLHIRLSLAGRAEVEAGAFNSNQFQQPAFHHCAYACWFSEACPQGEDLALDWMCSNCNRWELTKFRSG